MTTPDPLFDPLRRLADQSAPEDPAVLRHLGERRRVRRRQSIGAVAAVVVLATGAGALVSQLDQGAVPAPVGPSPATPTAPVPAPSPTAEVTEVTEQHVVRATDLRDRVSGMTWSDDVPPGQDEAPSSCQRAPWSELGATSEETGWMERDEGAISTSTALQFPDAKSASRAAETVQQWIEDCPAFLRGEGTEVPVEEVTWFPVQTEVGTAEFATVIAYRPAGMPEDEPWIWEDVGIVQVDARLGITVDRESTNLYDYVHSPEPDPVTGQRPNPQYPLLAAAALRLDQAPGARPDPSPSEAGEGALPDASLPQLEDFVWNGVLEFSDRRVSEGDGQAALSSCQQQQLSTLGASEVRVVTVESDVGGAAGVAGFDSAEDADAAWATLLQWADDCQAHLDGQGRGIQVLDDLPLRPAGHEGRYLLLMEPDPDGVGAEVGGFEEVGLVRAGDRIALVSFTSVNQDHIWATEEDGTGLPLAPMIRTLDNIGRRLAS